MGLSLPQGSRLGPYEILSPLGAGGMGEVYRARDTRLDRTVAIKVLPERLWRDEDMRQRFEREAKTISRLSHPHICAVHDVGRQDRTDYLVMAYLEGETLADRLSKGGALPLASALQYAREIADALECAHRQGIVHRDLKPGNVMLTKEGVKLLDFGLAKAFAPTASPESATSADTAQKDLTRDGTIVGTVQYMAPEQLEGREADARTDIFALGSVLYEMTTGKKAFSGASRASLMAAILEKQPEPLSLAASHTPLALDRLLRTALAKDPDNRWQSARDVGLQLGTIAELSETPAARTLSRGTSRLWKWLAAALTVALGLALFLRSRPMAGPGTAAIRFRFAPPAGGAFSQSPEGSSMAFSPDGTHLAFVVLENQRPPRLWQRTLWDPEPHPIEGTDGARSLFWSPDRRSLAFFAEGKLKRLDLSGGAAVTICDLGRGVAGGGIGRSGTWSPRGQILFADVQGDAIYGVPADGGRPEPVVRLDRGRRETRVVWPWFLPDGRRFLYMVRRQDGEGSVMLFDPGKAPRSILGVRSLAQYVDPGYLVFARDGALLGQRFDPDEGRLTGTPFSIAPEVSYVFSTGWAALATSRNGALAYQSHSDVDRMVWFDRAGRRLAEVGSAGKYQDLAISPDGKRLLFSRARRGLGTYDVWVLDFERGIETGVTSDPDTERGGVWLRDGKSILYSAVRENAPQLFRRELATGREVPLLPLRGFQQALAVSPDGRTAVFAERPPGGSFELFTLPLSGSGLPEKFGQPAFNSARARFSPDGRAVAFISEESGRHEAFVAPFGTAAERIRVSPEGAWSLCWSRDGKEIVYVGGDRQVIAVPVRTTPSIEVGRPVTLFRMASGNDWKDFDLAPDGRILAIVQEVSGNEQPATVAIHWTGEVQKN